MAPNSALIGIDIDLVNEANQARHGAASGQSQARSSKRGNKELTSRMISQIRYAFFNVMVGLFMQYE
jgi:hypothetical protein